jgi:hypothetical protein
VSVEQEVRRLETGTENWHLDLYLVYRTSEGRDTFRAI